MHKNGYHSHTHNHCKHDFLRYCEHCNVVYCEKCGQEWGQKATITYEYKYDPYVWTYRGVPYTVTWGGSDYTLTTSNGTVVKDQNVVSAFYSSSNQNSNTTAHTHNKS